MSIQLSNENKVSILVDLMKENRKQVEWVKNLDFKILYYTLAFWVAIVAWLSTKPPATTPKCVLSGAVILISILATGLFIRNHARHADLNTEFIRMASSLHLTTGNEYGLYVIYPKRNGSDWAFHLGRGLYFLFIIIGATFTTLFIWTLP
jgi:hypothetical protein